MLVVSAVASSLLLVSASAAAAAPSAAPPPSKPHIFSILQDDLGFADTGIYSATNAASKAAAQYTPNITALAQDGIVLTHHYVHWHCSPTRRTFLSGRLPIHHGEQLSKIDTDDMDLRWTWLPQKLQAVGYRTHGFGKEHTGFKSVHHVRATPCFPHFSYETRSLTRTGSGWTNIRMTQQNLGCFAQLWSNRGFTSSVGSLLTGGNYYYEPSANTGPRWQDQHPIYNDTQFMERPGNCKEQLNDPNAMCTQEYSTALWGQLAIQAVQEHVLPG
jgi:arylsulfatase A-like enzyme